MRTSGGGGEQYRPGNDDRNKNPQLHDIADLKERELSLKKKQDESKKPYSSTPFGYKEESELASIPRKIAKLHKQWAEREQSSPPATTTPATVAGEATPAGETHPSSKSIAGTPPPEAAKELAKPVKNPVTEESEPAPAYGTPAAASEIAARKPEPEPTTPRQAAEQNTKKMMQSDYAFARPSAVGNVGDDLAGSARHKRNAWRGLADAEKNGTAEALVTRDNLLKNEPHNLVSAVDRNPYTSLAMHYTLKAFPSNPGHTSKATPEKKSEERKQYLDTYREFKDEAEKVAAREPDPHKALAAMKAWTSDKIKGLRGMTSNDSIGRATAKDPYNVVANALVRTVNSIGPHDRSKMSVMGRMNEFAKHVTTHHGIDVLGTKPSELSSDKKEELRGKFGKVDNHIKDLIEGKTMAESFGIQSGGQKKYTPADLYISHASRKGGRDVSSITADPNNATRHLKDSDSGFGLRGVQFGNTVTDDERKHHAKHTVQAMTDLADVLGLKPQDLSLGKKLGLAIGARGKGMAAAHYEPDSKIINLTRASGVGSLAHEWGHAFDHYLNGGEVMQGRDGPHASYLSESPSEIREGKLENGKWVSSKTDNTKDPVWSAMDKVKQAWKDSGFHARVPALSYKLYKEGFLKHKPQYWNSHVELFARAFERYVQHKLAEKGHENTYLSGIVAHGKHGDSNLDSVAALWPTDAEVAKMAPAFDSLIAAYRHKKYGSHDPQQFAASDVAEMMASMDFSSDPFTPTPMDVLRERMRMGRMAFA